MPYREDNDKKDKQSGDNNSRKSDYIIKEAHKIINDCAKNYYEYNKRKCLARTSSIRYKPEDVTTKVIKAALFVSIALLVFVALFLIRM